MNVLSDASISVGLSVANVAPRSQLAKAHKNKLVFGAPEKS